MRNVLFPTMYRNNCRLKYLIFIFLSIILYSLCGCAAERKVQDNQFTSSSPQMRVVIDKEFQYLGTGTYNSILRNSNDLDGPGIGNYDVDFYFFAYGKTEKKTIQKAVIIYFSKISTLNRWWALPFFNENSKFIVDHGVKLLGGEYYEYAISFENTKDDNKIGIWLKQKGYMLPHCRIKIIFKKLEKDDLCKTVLYYEDAALSGFECSNWNDKGKLVDKQKKYIDKFIERADKAVQIMNSQN